MSDDSNDLKARLLFRVLRENEQLLQNLSDVQSRCTELLLENRLIRAHWKRVVGGPIPSEQVAAAVACSACLGTGIARDGSNSTIVASREAYSIGQVDAADNTPPMWLPSYERHAFTLNPDPRIRQDDDPESNWSNGERMAYWDGYRSNGAPFGFEWLRARDGSKVVADALDAQRVTEAQKNGG